MKLKYEPVYSLEKAMQVFEAQSREKSENHFVEGIMFSLDLGVIMTGKMVDTANKVSFTRIVYRQFKFSVIGTWSTLFCYFLNSFQI